MTTVHDIDLPAVLADRLTSASPDVLRELFALFIHTLMGAERMPCVGRATVSAAASAPTPATAIGTADSTPAQAHWIWRSPAADRIVFPGLAARTRQTR